MSKKKSFSLHGIATSILRGEEVELNTFTKDELRGVIQEIQHRMRNSHDQAEVVRRTVPEFNESVNHVTSLQQTISTLTCDYACFSTAARIDHLPCLQEDILDHIGEMIVLLDPELKIRWVNQAIIERTGLTNHELAGNHYRSLWCHEDVPCRSYPAEDALRTRKRQQVELELSDGSCLFLQASPLFSGDGEISGVVEVAIDISGIKFLEKSLNHLVDTEALTSEISRRFIQLPPENTGKEIDRMLERLGGFLNSSRCFLMVFDERSRLVTRTHEWFQNGLEKLPDLFHEDIAHILSFHQANRDSSDSIVIHSEADLPESISAHQDVWLHTQALPLKIVSFKTENNLTGCFCIQSSHEEDFWLSNNRYLFSYLAEIVSSAISRRIFLDRIIHSERQFRTLADSTNAGIILFRDNTPIYINQAAHQLTGFSLQEMTANDFLRSLQSQIENGEIDVQKTQEKISFVSGFSNSSGDIRWGNFQRCDISIDDGPASLLTFFDISDRVHFETALKESEEKLRSFIEQSYDGMALIDENGSVLVWNSSMEQISGLKTADVMGKPLWDVISNISPAGNATPELIQRYKKSVQAMLATGDSSYNQNIVENKFIRPDGEKGIMQSMSFPIKTRNGWMAGNIARDITEVKKLQEENRKQQIELEAIFDSIPALVYFKDRDFRFLRVNKAFQKATGYSKEFFDQRPTTYDIAARWETGDDHCDDDREVVNSGKAKYNIIKPLITDESKIYHIAKVPYRDENEHIIGVIGFAFEVTDRIHAENALKESQARYLSIFENSPIAIAEVDLSVFRKHLDELRARGLTDYSSYFDEKFHQREQFVNFVRFIDVNRAGITLFEAKDKEDFINNSGRLATLANLERIRQEFLALCQGKTYFEGKSMQYTYTGKPIYTSLRMTVAPGYEDSWEKVYLSISDVTEQVKAEEAIRNSLEEKEVMLREIHHRVKNNLQVIASLLNLQSNRVYDRRDLELFNMSRERVRSMALVHEKLYRSPNMAQVDFSDYLQQLSHDLVRTFSIHTAIDLHVEVSDIFLPVDKAIPCGLIVHELIMNSLKYAFKDRKKGTIDIKMSSTPIVTQEKLYNQYKLMIKDDGVGISEDIDIGKGETLGLQLVDILTRQLKGKLAISQNGGTLFTIDFPGNTSE